MSALSLFRKELRRIGYSAIESDYAFSNVFATSSPTDTVPLAAFTHKPPSYRNAALAVIEARESTTPPDYRALGAPLLFVISGKQVEVWQIHPEGEPTLRRETTLEKLGSLFSENEQLWNPQRIHSAKSFGTLNRSYQLDFVDAGLLPAIEGEIHTKLDRLLNETLAETVRLRIVRPGEHVDDRLTFRTIFRLLAAKVLQDREHELATAWNPADIDDVLRSISHYYKLPPLPDEALSFKGSVFESAWDRLRGAINFRNISSDDLAFIYENTLVTDETRAHFGVHSTPRSVAEYVVGCLRLWDDELESTNVYEPFAGAGVFMVAALRRLSDLLPVGMTEAERHRFLVQRISGDEIEPFAAEVAMLSLILADYPNENGWKISTTDLFEDYALVERASNSKVVLCNPPFEKFTPAERLQYPEAATRSPRKPIAALEAVLDAKPDAIGFVLPEPFKDGSHYRLQRERIESLYKDIEVVTLPDRVFKASVIRSTLLIAQEPRLQDRLTSLKSTVVRVDDRERFLRSAEVSESRKRVRPLEGEFGQLWINELDEVWEALEHLPVLASVAEIHRGIEWQGSQAHAFRREPQKGFRRGLHSSDAVSTFAIEQQDLYLDCRANRLRGGAIRYEWSAPKLLANAARLSRGPWCFAAAIDRSGLVASQQLFGVWARAESSVSLEGLCALLNSPVAVAYVSSHSPPDRLRIETLKSIPMPRRMPSGTEDLVSRYLELIAQKPALRSTDFEERSSQALKEIDAAVLEAYDLPPRLERRLLEYFRGSRRPVVHDWTDWYPRDFQSFVPLARFLSPEFQKAKSGWVSKVLKPLPDDEAEALREYLD